MGLIKKVTELNKTEETPKKIERKSITSQLRERDVKTSVTTNDGVPQKLSVHDTDYLMKMFLRSSIQGNEIEQAHTVFQKLKALHKGNIEDEN